VNEQERIDDFARRWEYVPEDVRQALRVVREHEAEGAYNPTMLADQVRGFFRQHPDELAYSVLGIIRDSVLNQRNEYIIWGETESTWATRIQARLNEYLPFGLRIDVRWRLIRQ
jgi:hypothetical protein